MYKILLINKCILSIQRVLINAELSANIDGWFYKTKNYIYPFLFMITSEASGLCSLVKEDSDTLPNSLKYHDTPGSHRDFEDGGVKWLCLYPSLYKEWFLNQHFSRWNKFTKAAFHLPNLVWLSVSPAVQIRPCCSWPSSFYQIFTQALTITPNFVPNQIISLKLCFYWKIL